jgi:(p)ppGpp synthase/HD superfamily hydrolase
MNDLTIAEMIAERAHQDQTRRDGETPYIAHVKAVVEKVTEDDEKIVAWLHDVVEDSELTLDDIASVGFSKDIITAVGLLTKTKGGDYTAYINGISENPLARTVKIADMKSNLEDTPTDRQVEKYSAALQILT